VPRPAVHGHLLDAQEQLVLGWLRTPADPVAELPGGQREPALHGALGKLLQTNRRDITGPELAQRLDIRADVLLPTRRREHLVAFFRREFADRYNQPSSPCCS
jgi:hypothetical protein